MTAINILLQEMEPDDKRDGRGLDKLHEVAIELTVIWLCFEIFVI